ncbi:MAG: hypothetical protein AABY43_02940, partial [Candidatus Omnitrophota bacterium]
GKFSFSAVLGGACSIKDLLLLVDIRVRDKQVSINKVAKTAVVRVRKEFVFVPKRDSIEEKFPVKPPPLPD